MLPGLQRYSDARAANDHATARHQESFWSVWCSHHVSCEHRAKQKIMCCTVEQRCLMFTFGLDIERSVCRMCNGFLIVLFFPLFPAVRHAATLPWRWDLWWWNWGEKDLWLGGEGIQRTLWFWQTQTHGRQRYVSPAQLCICLEICMCVLSGFGGNGDKF